MDAPAPPKPSLAARLFPIVVGFLCFSLAAVVDQRLALALAIGVIGYAAISMLIALFGKH
jgi:hypothetical protein